jgi:subtilase family serine protease
MPVVTIQRLMLRRKLLLGLTVMAIAVAGAGRAQAAPVPTLATTIPAIGASKAAPFVAAPPADAVMHLVVSLPLRNATALDGLLAELYNPASPHYHQYLSVEEFTARFGPSVSDYEKAAAFFQSQGLTVAAPKPNRYLLDVDGRVADIEKVFHVTMGLYRHPMENRVFMAPDRAPSLDLDVPVQQVIGLDNFVLPHTRLLHSNTPKAHAGSGSGPGGNFIGSDLRTAYYPQGTLTGAGQSVGLMELEGYNIADVNKFFSNKYGAQNSVSVVGIKTDSQSLSCTGRCDDSEQALDIEYTISIAPGLSSVRVYVGNVPEDVLNAMATDNISKILSTSWGWNENFATDDGLFKEFAAQGQTNLTASGDDQSLQASGPWPEEDANIVAVGGTDVVTKSPGGPWSAETGWNDSAGGPSVDKTIKIESYQLPFITKKNGGSKTLRNVPDIAANANLDMEICADGTCTGGYGGTSFASPMWAGIVALANQEAVADGKPVVGFINPAVYALAGGAGYSSQFHDETSGKSGLYSCTKSFDLVTGVGSPYGQAFIDALVAY